MTEDIQQFLRTNVHRFVKLDDDEFALLCSYLIPKKLNKGEVLLYEGNRCDYVYFVAEGCLKYYYLTDGEERIGQFFFENAWMSDMFAFLSREPARMNISAIEDAHLLALRHDDLEHLYTILPKIERFTRLLVQHTFISSQQRSASFLTQTPTEKYLQLVRTRPKVVSRVPQYMIAAYLGIKAESLSRIRKKLAQKD